MEKTKIQTLYEDFIKKDLEPELSKNPKELFEELKSFAETYEGQELPKNIRNILIILTLVGAQKFVQDSMSDLFYVLNPNNNKLN